MLKNILKEYELNNDITPKISKNIDIINKVLKENKASQMVFIYNEVVDLIDIELYDYMITDYIESEASVCPRYHSGWELDPEFYLFDDKSILSSKHGNFYVVEKEEIVDYLKEIRKNLDYLESVLDGGKLIHRTITFDTIIKLFLTPEVSAHQLATKYGLEEETIKECLILSEMINDEKKDRTDLIGKFLELTSLELKY